MADMRLDRLLSLLSVATRSEAKKMVRAGRVSINGVPANDAGDAVPQHATIAVDGQTIDSRLSLHLMLNKPLGVITAESDARHGTVMSLLPAKCRSLGCMPVGRLDKDTEGLLLFTTDGEIAHRLLSPKNGIEKIYRATVTGRLTAKDAEQFQEGITLSDFTAMPAALRIESANDTESTALVTVCEGKFHQVRRMFAAIGHEVMALKRLKFGPLRLPDGLAPGAYRELTNDEWLQVKEAAFHG